MRIGLIGVSLLSSMIWLSPLGFAQSKPSTPETVEAALQIEDPAARIAALQKFLKSGSLPEQSQTAREAIAASWAQLAEGSLGRNEIEKAEADFGKAIASLPEKISDRFFADTVIRIPEAVSARGYRNEAIGLARQLEKRFAKEPVRLAVIGEFYLTLEAPSDAIRVLETTVKLNDGETRFRRSLGAAYRMGLRLDDAIAEYQQTVNLDPEDKRAYYELANLYRAHGAYDDAVKLYRKQLKLDSRHLPTYKGLALAYLAQNDEAQATAVLNQIRGLGIAEAEITRDFYLQTQLAFYYLNLDNVREARKAASAALAVEPRYAWALIAAAEVEIAENKYFEAERNLLAAKKYASFPSLFFTLGKLYLSVEDFDGALEQFSKSFTYSPAKRFIANLGGALEIQAESVKELLSREHQAAIYLASPPTSEEQFKMIEALARFNFGIQTLKAASMNRNAKGAEKIDPDFRRQQLRDLDQAAVEFIEAERTRSSFRALYIAQQLGQAGVASETAVEFADQALTRAEISTEFEGSVRDYPNYDRDGRLRIFRGRALDARGWALFKAGKNREAVKSLTESVLAYGQLPEGKRALRHLAAVKESMGQLTEALDLYIAAYEAPAQGSTLDLNRAVIEGLYRKVIGSLAGLDARLKRAATGSSPEVMAILAMLPPAGQVTETSADAGEAAEPADGQKSRNDSPAAKPASSKPPAAKGRNASSDNPRPANNASTSNSTVLIPVLPASDPMFARTSPANPPAEPSPSEPAPAASTSAGTAPPASASTEPAPATSAPAGSTPAASASTGPAAAEPSGGPLRGITAETTRSVKPVPSIPATPEPGTPVPVRPTLTTPVRVSSAPTLPLEAAPARPAEPAILPRVETNLALSVPRKTPALPRTLVQSLRFEPKPIAPSRIIAIAPPKPVKAALTPAAKPPVVSTPVELPRVNADSDFAISPSALAAQRISSARLVKPSLNAIETPPPAPSLVQAEQETHTRERRVNAGNTRKRRVSGTDDRRD